MRGGRSLLVLLVLALGLGAYIYFVESKRDLTEPDAKKEKVFALEPGKIEALEVRAAAGDVTTIKKDGANWQITAPVAAAADAAAVNGIASTIETLESERVLEENPASVKDFGLEPARYSIGFKVAGETAMRRLKLGSKTPTGSEVYAQVEGQPKLFLISSFLEDSLNRTAFDLRDKTTLKFDREAVDSITLAYASAPQVSLAKKGTDWQLTTPVTVRADSVSVDGIVGRVFQLLMKSVAAEDGTADLKKYGLDKPKLVATFGAGSTRAALAIGGAADDASVYARDLSRPIVFTVEKAVLDDLSKKADDLRMKDLFVARSFTANGLEITHLNETRAFAKQKAAGAEASSPEVWKQTKPAAKDVAETAMIDLLNTVTTLRADSFVDKALASGEDIVVVTRSGDAAAPVEERVTLRKAGTVVHAIRPGEPGAAVVPVAEFDKLLTQLKALNESK